MAAPGGINDHRQSQSLSEVPEPKTFEPSFAEDGFLSAMTREESEGAADGRRTVGSKRSPVPMTLPVTSGNGGGPSASRAAAAVSYGAVPELREAPHEERVRTLFRVCPFILGNEFCERLAFYGCAEPFETHSLPPPDRPLVTATFSLWPAVPQAVFTYVSDSRNMAAHIEGAQRLLRECTPETLVKPSQGYTQFANANLSTNDPAQPRADPTASSVAPDSICQ